MGNILEKLGLSSIDRHKLLGLLTGRLVEIGLLNRNRSLFRHRLHQPDFRLSPVTSLIILAK